MLRKPRRLLILLAFAIMGFPLGAGASERPSYAQWVVSVALESTPAMGDDTEMITNRITLVPETGQVLMDTLLAATGRSMGREVYSVPAEQIDAFVDACLPGLLVFPDTDPGMALDGYYIYITVEFQGGYAVRFGGHMADILGPVGFREACAAIAEIAGLAASAAEADGT